MKVKFHGTRGSIPVCEPDFQEFGGNTTCVEVKFENESVAILDAGSGLRNLGKDLIARGHKQEESIWMMLTHFHWDHIQGFPFFEPAYDPSRRFTISAVKREEEGKNLQEIFETQMQREFFPVPLVNMGATFDFYQHEEAEIATSHYRITALKHNHPGSAYSYRIEDESGVLVFSTDIEHGEHIDERLVAFAKGADLLIHDAQFTPEELLTKRGWGHSSWAQALEVAKRADVKLLALTHHDPEHNDTFLREVEKQCQSIFPSCFLAREKLQIEFNKSVNSFP